MIRDDLRRPTEFKRRESASGKLEDRLSRLRAGEPVTDEDLANAEQAALHSVERSADAHRRAGRAYESAAEQPAAPHSRLRRPIILAGRQNTAAWRKQTTLQHRSNGASPKQTTPQRRNKRCDKPARRETRLPPTATTRLTPVLRLGLVARARLGIAELAILSLNAHVTPATARVLHNLASTINGLSLGVEVAGRTLRVLLHDIPTTPFVVRDDVAVLIVLCHASQANAHAQQPEETARHPHATCRLHADPLGTHWSRTSARAADR